MSTLLKVLDFFSLLDSAQRLSITNTAMYVVIAKIATSPSPTIMDLGALLLSLANYAHKRYTAAQEPAPALVSDSALVDLTKQIDDLTSKVNSLSIRTGLNKL